jgi:hypothetical protein
MADHCGCCHEHCRELKKPQSTYPLTMENLEKGVKNMNIIIDMIDTRQDEKREQMIVFLKTFFDDLATRYKNKDKPQEPPKEGEQKKEEEIPVMERINKSLLQVLQLKPAVMLRYGSELLDKVWEISDDINNYIPPEDLLSQPADKKLTPMEMMKYFLQLLFGGANKVEELLEQKFIIIEEDKRKITTNEDKIKEITSEPDKYLNENNLLCNLMIMRIFTYTKTEVFYTGITTLLMSLDNRVIKLYKVLSLYAFSLWNLLNKKEELVKSILYIIGGVLKDFSRSLLTTDKIDINTLTFFKERQKEEHFFKAIVLPEKSVDLLKKYLLITMVNFVSVFICGYDINKPYDIQDGNYWDDYSGLILRLKDPKLTEMEKNEIPRMIPLSLDLKSIILLYISDFLFFFTIHFCYVKDGKLTSDFGGFECLKQFAEYMVINSNYNILTFFQKNILHQRFNQCFTEKMEYEVKDNFNTYGLFFIFFSLLQKRKVPLIIKRSAYAGTMTEYLKIILQETKNFGLPGKKDELNKYYYNEMEKNKFIDENDEELKKDL